MRSKIRIAAMIGFIALVAVGVTAQTRQPRRANTKDNSANAEQRALMTLPQAKKNRIRDILGQMALCIDAYDNSSDLGEIAHYCQRATEAALSANLPNGFFRGSLRQGALAIDYAYLLRQEQAGGVQIPARDKEQIVTEYHLQSMLCSSLLVWIRAALVNSGVGLRGALNIENEKNCET